MLNLERVLSDPDALYKEFGLTQMLELKVFGLSWTIKLKFLADMTEFVVWLKGLILKDSGFKMKRIVVVCLTRTIKLELSAWL